MVFLFDFLIFIYSIILHEISHGWAAERLGDPTAKIQKRLTLNPFPHLDPVQSIILPLVLFMSGSPVIFGAAKPVPIDPYNFRNPKKDMGLTAAAGPLMNILIAVFLSLVARLLLPFISYSNVFQVLKDSAQLNIILAVFNLIPIPPLDGGRVAVALLPDKYASALSSLERFGLIILIFLLLFPTPWFSLPDFVSNLSNMLFSFLFPKFSLI